MFIIKYLRNYSTDLEEIWNIDSLGSGIRYKLSYFQKSIPQWIIHGGKVSMENCILWLN